MAARPHYVIVAKGGASWLGGRQYSLNLIEALIADRTHDDAYDVSVLVHGRDELVHYETVRPKLKACEDATRLLRPWSMRNRARWKFKRQFFGATNPRLEEVLQGLNASFVYPATVAKIPSADWISDFQYHHFPADMSAAEIADRTAEFSNIVNRARHVVLSSAAAARDCHALFPQSAGRTSVLPFRVFADPQWRIGDPLDIVRKYNLPERFALVSNWLLPTKNHSLVLDALAQVPPKQRRTMRVVCTGDIYDYRNPGFYNVFLSKIHTLGLQDHVSVLGVIPKGDQIQLLRSALFYLQPSLSEGWNTGVEEARLFGKPILLSDIAVHREQNPPQVTYFDPRNPAELAAKLVAAFEPSSSKTFDTEQEDLAAKAYRQPQLDFAKTFRSIVNLVSGRIDAIRASRS